MNIEVKKPHPTGGVETFRPHRYEDGCYRVEIPVKDLSEVERLAKAGCAVRMKGDIGGKVNLTKLSKAK